MYQSLPLIFCEEEFRSWTVRIRPTCAHAFPTNQETVRTMQLANHMVTWGTYVTAATLWLTARAAVYKYLNIITLVSLLLPLSNEHLISELKGLSAWLLLLSYCCCYCVSINHVTQSTESPDSVNSIMWQATSNLNRTLKDVVAKW